MSCDPRFDGNPSHNMLSHYLAMHNLVIFACRVTQGLTEVPSPLNMVSHYLVMHDFVLSACHVIRGLTEVPSPNNMGSHYLDIHDLFISADNGIKSDNDEQISAFAI